MLSPEEFLEELHAAGIEFFAGVPDSLLKDFLLLLEHKVPGHLHQISANEGAAIAVAAGHHLATGKTGLVYMQNSGLGNAVNPLMSLAHKDVYSIPMVLLVGWRGEPGKHDEPQHRVMGAETREILDRLHVPCRVLTSSPEEAREAVRWAVDSAAQISAPVALLCGKGVFSEPASVGNSRRERPGGDYPIREDALRVLVHGLKGDEAVICTTGKASRELYELRNELRQAHTSDFLNVGAMGHASQLAFGVALSSPDRSILCIDGDGAAIMHMGSLATIGQTAPRNFRHIILNNGMHESVGGQETAGFSIDLVGIARACGYTNATRTDSLEDLARVLPAFLSAPGPVLLEIRVSAGSRSDLGRPPAAELQQDKIRFAEYLQAAIKKA